MKNRIVTVIIILILVSLSLVFVYSADNTTNSNNKTELYVSTEGPIDLSKIINDIKTRQAYEGYDNETLSWMESLGDKKVFMGKGTIVVMNTSDASKLRSEYVCDADITQHIECSILENHSLGNVKFQKDVLLVDNVKYLDEKIHFLQGS